MFNEAAHKAAEGLERVTVVTESYYLVPTDAKRFAIDALSPGNTSPWKIAFNIAVGVTTDEIVAAGAVQVKEPVVVEIRRPTIWERFSGRSDEDRRLVRKLDREYRRDPEKYGALLRMGPEKGLWAYEGVLVVRTTFTTFSSENIQIGRPMPPGYWKDRVR